MEIISLKLKSSTRSLRKLTNVLASIVLMRFELRLRNFNENKLKKLFAVKFVRLLCAIERNSSDLKVFSASFSMWSI